VEARETNQLIFVAVHPLTGIAGEVRSLFTSPFIPAGVVQQHMFGHPSKYYIGTHQASVKIKYLHNCKHRMISYDIK